MRKGIILLGMLLWAGAPANAELNIGIHVNLFPQLMVVPGYPVYYAPDLDSNYFFYDDAYWVYQDDRWYSSAWYNGPWDIIEPEFVPLYILRIPVRYYRRPPQYFRGWQADQAPRWGEHWGNDWSQRRNGWDHWDRRSAPPPAPLPVYQRQYSGAHYPAASQQRALQPVKPSNRAAAEGDTQRDRPQRDRPQPPQRSVPVGVAPSAPRMAPDVTAPRQQPPGEARRNRPPANSTPQQRGREGNAGQPAPNRPTAAPTRPPQTRGDQKPSDQQPNQRKARRDRGEQRDSGERRDERPHP